jgi:hypothetical protein
LAHVESIRETFRKLRAITKNEDRSGIKRIDVPTTMEDGTLIATKTGEAIMRTIYDPKDVEQQLIDRNIDHFSQAHGTPFHIWYRQGSTSNQRLDTR